MQHVKKFSKYNRWLDI